MSASEEAQAVFDGLYAVALDTYLQRHDEDTLSAAYELGRRAMIDGYGVLDMATTHRTALASVVTRSLGQEVANVEAAEDFFRELLSPFEMMFRGYASANAELLRVNSALLKEQEAVLAANSELEAFSYSVSHDLRAPLRAMAGFSAVLQEPGTGPLNVEQGECVALVCDNAKIMNRLIEDLLGLSRVARADVVRARVDLSALAKEIAAGLKRADPERDVDVIVQEALIADADAGLLRVVISNLLGNAWKFTSKRKKAQIELGVTKEANEPVYFIRDDGAGFNMEYAKKLFGPFQRLHTKGEFEGTGIGLATVKRVIRRHGGRVWADGQLDRGATFYFTLGEDLAA